MNLEERRNTTITTYNNVNAEIAKMDQQITLFTNHRAELRDQLLQLQGQITLIDSLSRFEEEELKIDQARPGRGKPKAVPTSE